MKFCPTCHETYGNQLKFCPRDGSSLEVRGLSEDPLVGRMLSDRYEVLERLGAGGFGTVYRVRDTRLDDIEALKVFDRRRLAPNEANEAMARFEREAKLLRKLGRQSRHIVGVTNFIEDEKEELFYFAMEHVDGANIAQILIREGPLEMTRAITLVKQLCGALDTAHSQDPPIVHRDLKLENLMVRRQGTKEMLKVLDFGIAKIIGHGSLTDLHIGAPGTPGYAVPEQVERPDSIDCRTDLFAVGVVLFGMVTAREPWTGSIITEPTSDGWSLLRATVEGDPIPLRKVREDLPEALEKVIFKLLEKKQEDRFESATALAEALDDVERQMAVDVPAPSASSASTRESPSTSAPDEESWQRGSLPGLGGRWDRETTGWRSPTGGSCRKSGTWWSAPARRLWFSSPPTPSQSGHHSHSTRRGQAYPQEWLS